MLVFRWMGIETAFPPHAYNEAHIVQKAFPSPNLGEYENVE